jgi:hypothetical protein
LARLTEHLHLETQQAQQLETLMSAVLLLPELSTTVITAIIPMAQNWPPAFKICCSNYPLAARVRHPPLVATPVAIALLVQAQLAA